MPRLYLDSDTLRKDLTTLWNLRVSLSDLLQELDLQVDSLVSAAWLAPDAITLGNSFQDSRQTLVYQVNELDALLRNLEREISAWEELGSVFHRIYGDSPLPDQSPHYIGP